MQTSTANNTIGLKVEPENWPEKTVSRFSASRTPTMSWRAVAACDWKRLRESYHRCQRDQAPSSGFNAQAVGCGSHWLRKRPSCHRRGT
ncbi:hypothetical protein PS1_042043 [Malus domestica]